MLFDSYFTLESKLGWHRLFLTVGSTGGIRTLIVMFELLEEMVVWGCRNVKFNEQFQLPLLWHLLPSHVSWICEERLTFSKIYLEFDRFSRV